MRGEPWQEGARTRLAATRFRAQILEEADDGGCADGVAALVDPPFDNHENGGDAGES